MQITSACGAEKSGGIRQITRGHHEKNALQLRGLSVTLDDGTGIVNETEVDIAPGEKILIMGDSGSGKSTLVRAIAGLWPWGDGEVVMQRDAKLLMLPQKSYIPIGSLRRAATYPMAADKVPDEEIRNALEAVVSPVFDRIANTFVDSFVTRAGTVYGPR